MLPPHLTDRKQEPSRGEQPIGNQRHQEAERFLPSEGWKELRGGREGAGARGSHMAAVRMGRGTPGAAGPGLPQARGSLRPGVPSVSLGERRVGLAARVPSIGNPWVIL